MEIDERKGDHVRIERQRLQRGSSALSVRLFSLTESVRRCSRIKRCLGPSALSLAFFAWLVDLMPLHRLPNRYKTKGPRASRIWSPSTNFLSFHHHNPSINFDAKSLLQKPESRTFNPYHKYPQCLLRSPPLPRQRRHPASLPPMHPTKVSRRMHNSTTPSHNHGNSFIVIADHC